MTGSERTTLAGRIRAFMAGRGMNQSELAEAARVNAGYLSQLLHGTKDNPSVEVLGRLAAALGVQCADLLGEERSPVGAEERLPRGLRGFADEMRARGQPIPEEDIRMLVGIRYRGRQPRTPEDWALLYDFIKRLVR